MLVEQTFEERMNQHNEMINDLLLKQGDLGISKLLTDLDDYNLYSTEDDEIIEEDDGGGINTLYYNITISLYENNFKLTEKFLTNPKYIKRLKGEYILKSNGEKITLDRFLPYIYLKDGMYRMVGDEPIENK